MRVYLKSKSEFLNDVLKGNIEEEIAVNMKKFMGINTSSREKRSWHNSMEFMYTVLSNSKTPDNCGVAIEYNIPCSNLRADIIITGKDENHIPTGVIIELKQWEMVKEQEQTHRLVKACYRDGSVWRKDLLHPSYQSWSYSEFMKDTLKEVQEGHVNLYCCSFLHNCVPESEEILTASKYSPFIEGIHGSIPYVETDLLKLIDFIDDHIIFGDCGDTINILDNSEIRPSKELMRCVGDILGGNHVFNLIDDQIVIYEKILRQYRLLKDEPNNKYCIIVHGGPGTGKSVIALSLMGHIISKYGKMSYYVTTNATPRMAYEEIMSDGNVKKDIRCLFKGTSSFVKQCKDKDKYEECENQYDMLLVDEAHRLAPKDELFNSEIGQIQSVLHVSKFTVFFIDEGQHVFVEDDGNVENIKKWAAIENVKMLPQLHLKTEFRCGGSNGYLEWLYSTLQKENTREFNYRIPYRDYNIDVLDDPADFYDWFNDVSESPKKNARIVAGYCWEFESKNDPNAYDIKIGKKGFKRKWNNYSDKYNWALEEEGYEHIGAIHTCQGLEFDYIGVIIGKDMTCRGNKIVCIKNHPKSDRKTFYRLNKLFPNPIEAEKEVDRIVKNTYSVLMSRGKKGCRIYCEDEELKKYFKKEIERFHKNSYHEKNNI